MVATLTPAAAELPTNSTVTLTPAAAEPSTNSTAALTTAAVQATQHITARAADITWGPCEGLMPAGVECGTLDVPVDWSDPQSSPRAQIAVAIHRATKDRRGTFTYNPGGPGTSGLLMLPIWLTGGVYGPSGALPRQVLDHYDIVAWDPRGVGLSEPQLQGCDATATYGDLPQAGPIDWQQVAETYAASVSNGLLDCLKRNPDLAPYLGTSYVIRDVEALRIALGVEEWTYYGSSYGTTIGMTYARAYPDRVRALVLDGVAPPSQTLLTAASTMSWGWSYALRQFVGVYGAKFAHKVDRVIRALDRGPLVIDGVSVARFGTDEFSVGLDNLVSSLWMQRRYESLRANFVALYRAARQRGSVLEPVPPMPARQMPIPYAVSFVMCADRTDRPTPSQAAALAETAAAAGLTVAGIKPIERGLWCSGLPALGIPLDNSTMPLRLANSALVVNANADPKTPWLRARVGASTIAKAPLITYSGTQHGLYRRVGSTCVDSAVTTYLLRLELPKSDLACPFTIAP